MSKPGTPVICLETEERFESMKEAMERYGVSSGSLNSALAYGYSTGGYHFYRADEPKPDDSFFKSGNGGKGSSKKRPVICLETGVQFESAIAALKWLDSGKTNNRGNMRTALISGSALLGYHFYYADEAADFAPFLYDASFSTRGAYLKVSSPGNIYREAGFPQDPFFYTYNHLRDALVPKGFYPSTVRVRHPHGLTLEQIKRLPELLERPVVLMDSDRDDTMIAVLADVDEDGFPLIAALRPGGNAVSEGRSVGGTIVCSFYGKPENYFRFKMQQMPQRVLYQDIEKGRELDARAKLQLFGGNIASPDLDRRIIRPPECIVKLRADTPQMETHGRETSRVRRESRDMASGRAALDAGRRAETARVTERHIDSNLK